MPSTLLSSFTPPHRRRWLCGGGALSISGSLVESLITYVCVCATEGGHGGAPASKAFMTVLYIAFLVKPIGQGVLQ